MFYVITSTIVSGTCAKTIYDYANIASAKEAYHNQIGYNFNSAVLPTLDYFLVELLDKDGNIIARETYYAPASAVAD